MILGCAIWLGKGKPAQYLTSVTSFILKNSSKDTKVSLFYSKNKFNLPEHFKELYQEFQKQHPSSLPEYEVFIKQIVFFDIDADFKNDKYIAWLEQFEPTPYAFISDYLRYAILFNLACTFKNRNYLIAFFELDVEFKSALPGDLPADTLTLPELESALYLILVNMPKGHSLILLGSIVKVYNDLYQKILCHLDVKNKPSSLDILENEKFVTAVLGMGEDISEEHPKTTSTTISAGHVNLRGFYKVVQGLALEVMRECDEEMGAGNYLSAIDMTPVVDHFPSSQESIYKEDAYKLKTEQVPTNPHSVDAPAANSQEKEPPKIIKSSRNSFFELPDSKKTKKQESVCLEVVTKEGPPF